MIDEADLSAEQPGAGTPPRLPLADGDSGRPQGDPRAPGARPKEAVGLTIICDGSSPLPHSATQQGTIVGGRVEERAGAVTTIRARRDFLAANAGRRAQMPGFVLLARPRGADDPTMRIGLHSTTKRRQDVVRNRTQSRSRSHQRRAWLVHGRPA